MLINNFGGTIKALGPTTVRVFQLLYPVLPRLAMSERSDRCRPEEMKFISERDLRLRDESTRKIASVTDQRIRHLLMLALDDEGVVGTVTSAQNQRKALHSGHSLSGSSHILQRQTWRLLRPIQTELRCAPLGNLPTAIVEEAEG